tara:strand:+ start:2250 stop:2444 length:195 start_codon:yes stop_codon:yes gene_type:complete
MEPELRKLSEWLQDVSKDDLGYDYMRGGILEEKIAQSQVELLDKIGQYIEEILDMKKEDTRDCI